MPDRDLPTDRRAAARQDPDQPAAGADRPARRTRHIDCGAAAGPATGDGARYRPPRGGSPRTDGFGAGGPRPG